MSNKIQVQDNRLVASLVGEQDTYLRILEDGLQAQINVRGNEINITGPESALAAEVVAEMIAVLESGQLLDKEKVRRSITMVRSSDSPAKIFTDQILTTATGKPVVPKTAGQKKYLDCISKNMVTFGIGPAGTGKSWLAVACAVRALQNKEVGRILLTRPAVEAGERLGYLPGDLMSKVDPFLRPLYDALSDLVGAEKMTQLFNDNVVEVAPLAFMRGRTLNNSFIILDEAQNTSPQQMMMFLTRIGFGSKAVITGDRTQLDIANGKSGLAGLESILSSVEGVGFSKLTSQDVVRHRIVQDIVDAYESHQDTNR